MIESILRGRRHSCQQGRQGQGEAVFLHSAHLDTRCRDLSQWIKLVIPTVKVGLSCLLLAVDGI